MKKTIWILLGAALLLGIILFICLRQKAPDSPADPSLPSLNPEQGTAQNGNPHNTAENGASDAANPNGAPQETGDSRTSGPAETEPAIPIDWNQNPSETAPSGQQPQTSENPGTTATPDKEERPSDSGSPSLTEQGEETQPETETGGQIVIPILPPDIFP